MEKRKQFTFYGSFYEALVKLPIDQAQQGLWAIVTYGLFGKLPEMELSPAADAVLVMAKPVLDAGRKKSAGVTAGNKMRGKKKEVSQIPPRCVPDTVQEGEKEVEVENEVEVEEDKDKEKKSLYTDGVCVIGDTDTDRFERFWNLYPMKLGKQKAWEAWQAVKPDLDKLVTALECWKRSRQWRQDNGRFIPKAENFLKETYYLQIPEDTVPMGASGHLGKAELEAIQRLMRE